MKTTFLQAFILLLLLSSCVPSRSLIYLNDLKGTNEYTEKILNNIDYKIQTDDLLGITVSSMSPESNALFNTGTPQAVGSVGGSMTAARSNDGYLVDKNGNINFPVLGELKIAGLTIEQATAELTTTIGKSIKKPIVNIRLLNFRVTVVGEVNHPGTFSIPNQKISLIEAIGLAGDLTAYGKRDNILIIREKDSVRSVNRVNLGSKNILNSPFFYLEQNDVVYIEPAKARVLQSGTGSYYLPIISIVVSLISVLAFTLSR